MNRQGVVPNGLAAIVDTCHRLRHLKLVRRVAITVLVGLALTGCGGSSSEGTMADRTDSAATDTTATSTESAATKTTPTAFDVSSLSRLPPRQRLLAVLEAPPSNLGPISPGGVLDDYSARDLVDTGYPLYDESILREDRKRAKTLRDAGLVRAVRVDFDNDDLLVVLKGLLLADAASGEEVLGILRDVYVDTFLSIQSLDAKGFGPGAWGVSGQIDSDAATAFAFRVNNVVVQAHVASIGDDHADEARALARELYGRVRSAFPAKR